MIKCSVFDTAEDLKRKRKASRLTSKGSSIIFIDTNAETPEWPSLGCAAEGPARNRTERIIGDISPP